MEEGGWGGGEIMNTQEVSSALVDRAGIIRLNLYSGQGAFAGEAGGGGEGGRDIFLSHHAPAAGPKLAQRAGQFLQG